MLNDLIQNLMKTPSPQKPQFRLTDDEDELEVRHLGKWISNGGEDDDWERLDEKSFDDIAHILQEFNDKNNTNFTFSIEEKNWITFYEE